MSSSCFGSCRREGTEAGTKNVLSLSCREHPLAMGMLRLTVGWQVGRGEPVSASGGHRQGLGEV